MPGDSLHFREGEVQLTGLPEWVMFFLEMGYRWADEASGQRHILVISTPCDSAAAGLLALGALRRRLEIPSANDVELHFQRLEELGRGSEAHTMCHKSYKGRFVFDRSEAGRIWVRKVVDSAEPVKMAILPNNALDWRFEGEPPVQVMPGGAIPNGWLYDRLVHQGGPVHEANLSLSDSGVCLAARGSGASATRSVLTSVEFLTEENRMSADLALTIHLWQPKWASRVTLFNTRTGESDRQLGYPRIVAADGLTALQKVLETNSFSHANVVAIVNRVVERAQLEGLSAVCTNLRQWYDVVESEAAPTPKGISVATFRRR